MAAASEDTKDDGIDDDEDEAGLLLPAAGDSAAGDAPGAGAKQNIYAEAGSVVRRQRVYDCCKARAACAFA